MADDDGDADPWGFLADRTSQRPSAEEREDSTPRTEPSVGGPIDPAPTNSAPAPKRARGELRTIAEGPSLRKRAVPMAMALALVSLAGFLTEAVAASQMLALAGPVSLLVIYPLGGVALIGIAVLQFSFVDHRARLPMLRVVSLGYAVAFGIALALVLGSVLPIVATGLIWLLADQLNFLVPLLVWSLAGDEFNVAEGRKVFGWIVSWTYAGQVLGLAVATVSPALLTNLGIPLPALLVIDPIACLVVGLWLPRVMRHSAAGRGSAKPESLSQSLRSAWDFINGVPVWRSMLIASILTFAAGMTAYMGFLSSADEVIGADPGRIQTYLGAVSLVAFLVCWAIQVLAAERIQERLGIPGVLLVLPIATVVASLVLALGAIMDSLPVLAVGVAIWWIPRWSIDENARRAALALVPDERRARVSFFIDLGPVALGLILSGLFALVGVLLDRLWLVPLVAALIALLAIPPSITVVRGWDDSLLNWRLRRRKQNRAVDLGE